MRTLCFATNNPNKLAEIQGLLGQQFLLQTLKEIGCEEEIPETHDTIPENSRQKAAHVWTHYQVDNFADDSGLIIPALNGEPGVHSAYYAGPQRSAADNIRLVLEKLQAKDDRSASFLTVITLVVQGVYHTFEGRVDGRILPVARGGNGFGYDPIFVPDGTDKTFAEMAMAEKARISHRARAFVKLTRFLRS